MSSKKNFFRMNTLKQFDAFARPLEELQIKTIWGGIVTLICFLTIGCLMMSNLIEYLDDSPTEELLIDTSRNERLQINVDIIIPKISCDFLALDAVDNSGETHLQVDNIFKQKLNSDGQPIEKSGIDITEQSNSESNKTSCGSCYGAESEAIKCCNSCNDVMKAYKSRNWEFIPFNIDQCKNQSYINDMYDTSLKDGCNLYGTFLVNRVNGFFRIVPGMSFSFNHIHDHNVKPPSLVFNTSHIIRHLSFGQKLESFSIYGGNPLDTTQSVSNEGATVFQYYIKIVPTLYQRRDGTVFSTNQFSITKHEKIISYDKVTTEMPGIFFSYEFSPIMVKYSEKPKLLGHLFTQFLSNISGVFICFWIMDMLMYKVTKIYRIHKKCLPNTNK